MLHKNTALPTALPPDLAAAEFVFIRRDSAAPPLTPPYTGPFKVLRRSLHTFQVQVGTKTETISTHRLKSCVSPPDMTAAEPPRRGRPPLAPPGAQTPYQNPGEKTSSKNRAEADRKLKVKKCPQSVKTKGKNPRFRAPLSSSAPFGVKINSCMGFPKQCLFYATIELCPRVRARALRAPVFLGSLPFPMGRYAPHSHRSFAAPPK